MNSLFLRKSVKLIAWRGHKSSRQATTPAQSQQREQMAAAHWQAPIRTGRCRNIRDDVSAGGRESGPRYTFKSPRYNSYAAVRDAH